MGVKEPEEFERLMWAFEWQCRMTIKALVDLHGCQPLDQDMLEMLKGMIPVAALDVSKELEKRDDPNN